MSGDTPSASVTGRATGLDESAPGEGDTRKKPDREWARSVWQVVCDIPEGHVLTYGEVARLSGAPRFARRVGQAMRWAPKDLALPWHRVINAQGKISFPSDSNAYREQKRRLEAEGVVILKGRIDLERYGYQGALDKLFWAEPG